MRSSVLSRLLRCLLLGATWLAATTSHATPPEPAADSRWHGRYLDPDDGQFDLSDHLLMHRGLLPMAIIITEPALGFVGAGKAYGGRADWSEADTEVAKGAGLRYLIARKLGLYTGIDFAWGPEDRAFYVQVGGAWF